MSAYYNDSDPFAADWLERLIAAGHLPAGDVDRRSIEEVSADDLKGYTQVHMFAGIGGWPLALRYAGWPDDRPVWTGSCPCQPLSSAGKRQGAADARHLWPVFYRLISVRRPPVLFGEQVAGALGREWLAGVRVDLEGLGYAVGAADLPAGGVAAPIKRQRLYFVGITNGSGRAPGEQAAAAARHGRPALAAGGGRMVGASDCRHVESAQKIRAGRDAAEPASRMGSPDGPGSQGRDLLPQCADQRHSGPAGLGHWDGAEWIECADGKRRRVEPGIRPLAPRLPEHVGLLRGAGNSIVPQVAAAFVTAAMEAA